MSFSLRLLQNSSGSARVPPRFRAGRPEPQLRQGCRNSTRLPTKTDWIRPRFRLGSVSVPCGSTIFLPTIMHFIMVMMRFSCKHTRWGGTGWRQTASSRVQDWHHTQLNMHMAATTCRHDGFAGGTAKPSADSTTNKMETRCTQKRK